jgi:hypothetical protein
VSKQDTRINVTSSSLDDASISQFDPDPLLRASELLADAGLDVIAGSVSGTTPPVVVDGVPMQLQLTGYESSLR